MDLYAQQCAVSLLSNLLTDVFEPKAEKTLEIFMRGGGLAPLLKLLHGEFPIQLYAAAALQNVTALDPGDCCTRLCECLPQW